MDQHHSILCCYSNHSSNFKSCRRAAHVTHLRQRSFKLHVSQSVGGTRRQSQRAAARSLRALRGLQRPGQRAQTGSTGGEKEEVRELSCLHGNCTVDTAITSSSQAAVKRRRFILSVQRRSRVRPAHFHLLQRVPGDVENLCSFAFVFHQFCIT